MTTPEGKFTPKNYIVSRISKNLLTPCRRVGLSRTKKTPKSIKPETPISQKEKASSPVECAKSSTHFIQDNDLNITPKRCSNSKLKRQVKASQEKKEKKSNKERADDSVKCNMDIDKNKVDILKNLLSENNQEVSKDTYVRPNLKHLIVNEQKELEPDSPPSSPVVSQVTVQIHHVVAKRNIFNEAEQSQDFITSKNPVSDKKQVLLDTAQDKQDRLGLIPLLVGNSSILEPVEETISLPKSKKRKLRLDSDDLESIASENPSEPEDSSKLKNQLQLSSVRECLKLNRNESFNETTLTRFTTDDYLQEYSKNPETFQENLDIESPSIALNDDDFNEFVPSKQLKLKKSKTEDKKENKNYMAIFCPLMGTVREESKILNDITSPRKLTVSLERINKKSNNEKKSNNSNSKLKKVVTKLNFTNDESDDEMFTSSPESDKKQRENLLQLILKMEKEVKQKEETLERLKQAQVYKKIHSPEKLNKSSDKWRDGCRTALKDLLIKMQEHGPIQMENLIKNLGVPDIVAKKLNL